MEWLRVDSVEDARGKLREHITLGEIELPIEQCQGKVLARDVAAPADIPAFDRSTVDGYAVVAKDTAAAGESLPVVLGLAGEVLMGAAAEFAIGSGSCAYVPTGGMLPAGADAVVMVEYSESFGEDVALYKPVGHGENVVRAGEDACAGTVLLARGRVLRVAEIGALAAAGVNRVRVYRPPSLVLISTGDELAAPGEELRAGQVYDINTFTLRAYAEKNGFTVLNALAVPDDEALLEQTVRDAMAVADVVAVSGGSSRGKMDATARVLERVSSPGIFTRGVAIKPGKPTILGVDTPTATLLVGLPGHPVSALIVFETLICDTYRRLMSAARPPAVPARLTVNVPASPGKATVYPAALAWAGDGYEATPVFGKSGLITTLTNADGYFEIERGREGLPAGEIVRVYLF